jgi:hypothetical protein
LWTGFWPELAALAEWAVLIAILARPVARTREQIVLVAALFVAIAFTYYLMLPIAGASALLWLYGSRSRLRRHWWFLVATAVPAAVAASVMVVVDMRAFPSGDHLLAPGSILPTNHRVLLGLGLLVLAAILASRALRSFAWCSYLMQLVLTVGFVGWVAQYHLSRLGMLGYFYHKSAHLLMVILPLGLGAVARLIQPVIAPLTNRAFGRRLTAAVASVVLALSGVAVFGPFGPISGEPLPLRGHAFGREYLDGKLAWDWPAEVSVAVAQRLPERDGVATLIWTNRGVPAHATHWTGSLLRTNGVNWRAEMWIATYSGSQDRVPDWRRPDWHGELWLPDSSTPLSQLVLEIPVPLRVVSDDPTILAELRKIKEEHPGVRLEIVEMPLP